MANRPHWWPWLRVVVSSVAVGLHLARGMITGEPMQWLCAAAWLLLAWLWRPT